MLGEAEGGGRAALEHGKRQQVWARELEQRGQRPSVQLSGLGRMTSSLWVPICDQGAKHCGSEALPERPS